MEDWEIKDIINRRNTSNVNILFEKKDNTPLEMIKDWVNRKLGLDVRYNIIAHNRGGKVAHMVNVFISGDEEVAKGLKKGDEINIVDSNSTKYCYVNSIPKMYELMKVVIGDS